MAFLLLVLTAWAAWALGAGSAQTVLHEYVMVAGDSMCYKDMGSGQCLTHCVEFEEVTMFTRKVAFNAWGYVGIPIQVTTFNHTAVEGRSAEVYASDNTTRLGCSGAVYRALYSPSELKALSGSTTHARYVFAQTGVPPAQVFGGYCVPTRFVNVTLQWQETLCRFFTINDLSFDYQDNYNGSCTVVDQDTSRYNSLLYYGDRGNYMPLYYVNSSGNVTKVCSNLFTLPPTFAPTNRPSVTDSPLRPEIQVPCLFGGLLFGLFLTKTQRETSVSNPLLSITAFLVGVAFVACSIVAGGGSHVNNSTNLPSVDFATAAFALGGFLAALMAVFVYDKYTATAWVYSVATKQRELVRVRHIPKPVILSYQWDIKSAKDVESSQILKRCFKRAEALGFSHVFVDAITLKQDAVDARAVMRYSNLYRNVPVIVGVETDAEVQKYLGRVWCAVESIVYRNNPHVATLSASSNTLKESAEGMTIASIVQSHTCTATFNLDRVRIAIMTVPFASVVLTLPSRLIEEINVANNAKPVDAPKMDATMEKLQPAIEMTLACRLLLLGPLLERATHAPMYQAPFWFALWIMGNAIPQWPCARTRFAYRRANRVFFYHTLLVVVSLIAFVAAFVVTLTQLTGPGGFMTQQGQAMMLTFAVVLAFAAFSRPFLVFVHGYHIHHLLRSVVVPTEMKNKVVVMAHSAE